MYLVDGHMHSSISKDSETPRIAMAQSAVERGLDEICFTDHYDILDFDGSYNPTFDWFPARAQQRQAVDAWGDRIKIHYGLELGNAPADFEAGERVQREPGLDCVLCSVHNLSMEVGRTDFYDVCYNTPEICYAHLDDYFQSMLRSVEWGKFDVLAHIPYPLRYMRDRDGQKITLDRYQEQIRTILRFCIEDGHGVEVNTKNWGASVCDDYVRLMKTYRALGGEIVTVGSDAHAQEYVGAGIAEAYAMLKELGFRYIAVYTQRKPHFIKLED